MLTENHYYEVHQYLISKKLSIDIFSEIEAHFIENIERKMTKEDISFETAFKEEKIAWLSDFKLVHKNPFSNKKIPKIIFDIDKEKNKNLAHKTLYISISIVMCQLIIARIFNEDIYMIFMSILSAMILFLPFTLIMMYTYQQRLLNNIPFKNIHLNNYLNPFLSYVFAFSIDQMMNINVKQYLYNKINYGLENISDTITLLLILISCCVTLFLYIYSFLTLKVNINYLKSLKKDHVLKKIN